MEHRQIRFRLGEQGGRIARWQMLSDGLDHWVADWWAAHRPVTRPHSGVYTVQFGRLTDRDRWHAATLTAPGTSLTHLAAAGFWALTLERPRLISVTRPGNRGVSQHDGLRIHYSSTLDGEVTVIDGTRVTRPERTVIDCWPLLDVKAREKLLREALRRRVTTPERMMAALDRHRRRRGLKSLRRTVEWFARLGLHRCRSDAEAYGLTVLDAARRPLPTVNGRFAGEEADFCWPDLRLIIEIDGPSFHVNKDEDARKTAAWVRAGFRVVRISSDDLFADPTTLLVAAPR